MTQTAAIFVDAYRSLNSKKLFWVALAISALVVAVFGCVGINERGIKILFWQFDSFFNAKFISPAVFYKQMFVYGGIGFWLSWLATILALISTAGIFPDLISSGVIDLFVSKPIGRLRLFVTEYAAGLLFVTLQVTIFSLGSFLVIGLRGGVWEPGLFVAVPVVVCFFSYLFSVCTLLGILTRSTVAALLLTLLFWLFVYGTGAAEQNVLMFETMAKHDALAAARHQSHAAAARGRKSDAGKQSKTPDHDEASDGKQSTLENLDLAQRILHGVMTPLPKTTETIGLLQRWLISLADLPRQPAGAEETAMRSAQREFQEALYQRSPFWIVGTSLGFESVVLGCAAWLFCRRDF